jgi:hypothetical protein
MPVRSMNTYVYPVGKTRLAKNTYGADFHLLSARYLIGHVTCFLRICSHFTERDRRRTEPIFRALGGGLYEGYLDDTFSNCFCSVLIDRIALGSQHSGLHELDVGQRPAKSLGSWTPFRFQKIRLHRSTNGLTYARARRESSALLSAAEAHFGSWG